MLERIKVVLACVCGVMLLALLDFASILARAYGQFATSIEWGLGALMTVTASAPVGIAVSPLCWMLAARNEKPTSTTASLARPVMVLALLGAAVFSGASTGRAFDALPRRVAFVALGAAMAACLAAVGFRVLQRHPRWERSALALAIIVATLATHLILPAGYPWFHVALSVSAAVLAGSLGALMFGQASLRALLACSLAGLLLMVPAFRAFGTMDHTKGVIIERGLHVPHALRLVSSVLAPDRAPTLVRSMATESSARLTLEGTSILLITVDALRADRLSALGAKRPTPGLDALAAEGVLFSHAYTPAPHTSYAMASLMTGKYIRPLLRQGLGKDSETLAGLLRRYGYKTGAFFPPAVFFVDRDELAWLDERNFDFEHVKREFADGSLRGKQLERFLRESGDVAPVFAWVHVFEPHEPYEDHPAFAYGARDIDRYDEEVAAADAAVAGLARTFRALRPQSAIVVTADHGEEFDEHGGRFHGTTVYEEQVRVPLVVVGPGVPAGKRVERPVSLVDVMPTLVEGLGIPKSARLQGRSIADDMVGEGPQDPPPILAEAERMKLYGEAHWRLVCRDGTTGCSLFDVASDPREAIDVALQHPARVEDLRRQLGGRLVELTAFDRRIGEQEGLAPAIAAVRSGDTSRLREVASLLDDARPAVRRAAAEVLFDAGDVQYAPALALALSREDDHDARSWMQLALFRAGHAVPGVVDLLGESDARSRLAALALAERGDHVGAAILHTWFVRVIEGAESVTLERGRQLVRAVALSKSLRAATVLAQGLKDVRLRSDVATALGEMGKEHVVPALMEQLAVERYPAMQASLAQALVRLGAEGSIAPLLQRLLGAPDPIPGGLRLASEAGVLAAIGGPDKVGREALDRASRGGATILLHVRAAPGGSLQLVCDAERDGGSGALGEAVVTVEHARAASAEGLPTEAAWLSQESRVEFRWAEAERVDQRAAVLPKAWPSSGAIWARIVATQNLRVFACAIVPVASFVPPPAPVEPVFPHRDDG